MGVQVEKLEHNMVKLTIEVDAATFDAAIKTVYNKRKGSFNLPGFRKGKVPMNVIEKAYGTGVFYEDAANEVMPKAYADAIDEADLQVVSRPEIEVTQIGKGEAFVFNATVAVRPEVTLGQYKDLEVEKESTAVSEEEIEAEMKLDQEKNAREVEVTDRPVKDGDIITLNYAGTIDGVPFDGGTAENQSLTIGSKSFIDTFEDQLVGMNIDDEKDVEVTFPEEYHAEELAGKPAVFHVKVLGIKERILQDLDDDYAADYTEFDTFEEYKASVAAKLAENKEAQAKSAMENDLLEKAMANAEADIPEAMIDSQVEDMAKEFEQRVSYQGISFEQYLQFTGQDPEKFMEDLRPEAEKRIMSTLVLDAIVKAENIEATDEDVDKEFERMAAMYQMEVEQIKGYMPAEQTENMKKDLAMQKAIDFLLDHAVVTEK